MIQDIIIYLDTTIYHFKIKEMKSLLGVLLASLLLAGVSFGQVTDTTQVHCPAGSTATNNKNRLSSSKHPLIKRCILVGICP